MVAQRAEVIISGILFVLWATPGLSGDHVESATSPDGIESRIASHRLADAVVQLEQRMEACRDREIVIPAERLTSTGLDDEPLRLALQYFSLKADNDCIADAAGRFVIESNMAERAGIMGRARERMQDSELPENAKVGELVLHSRWQEIKLEAKYRKLPEEAQRKLEAIEQLQQPFDPVASAEAAGLL